jgi:hypothetical protein
MADPDYGDITDLASGRDVVVEFRTAEESGKNYPETSIRVKPNSTTAVDPKDSKMLDALKNQTDILDLFPEPKYEELKEVMTAWLNPEEAPAETVSNSVVDDETTQPVAEAAVQTTSAAVTKATSKSPTASTAKSNTEDLTKAFDNLFNS